MMNKAVCITVYYKIFPGSTKQKQFSQRQAMLYFVLFSLKIRLLSPELFFSVLGKGMCECLLAKRFTTMRNLICRRECRFLSIFTSTPVIQCSSHGTVQLSLMKFILYKNHGSQEEYSLTKTMKSNSSVIIIRCIC